MIIAILKTILNIIRQRFKKGVIAERVQVYRDQESSNIANSNNQIKEKEKDYD
jgi:hypothetical protein